ncbi:MAG: HNH endonuclease family protein [Gordonia sp. (in: high G+C Gram-positive bacteria)]|uniref:HNH endonuclease family protein n=1 Tax=Gordonia sp. (in: high G+C Gram-positive bacteria) TaxID=84139 RepID=UPI0039E6E6FA
MTPTTTWRAGLGAVLIWSALTGCSVAPAPTESGPAYGGEPTVSARPDEAGEVLSSLVPSPSSAAAPFARARALLDGLPVKGKAPRTGYRRSVFGRAWSDDVSVPSGRNGCRTREDVLQRDLTDVVLQGRCKVMSGWLDDPYTGERLHFERGVDVKAIQIDHVVALADAWRTGAQEWTPQRRLEFANDPRNLQTTAGWANRRKGSSNAASWLPPNKSFRCTYVGRQIEVKQRYGLWVVAAERDAMRRVLAKCGA